MSTGRPPFRAETTYGILRRVTDETARPMRELNPEVPVWFDAVVMKLLRKSAGERFESAEQIAGIFEECLGHLQQPTACPLPLAVRALLPEKATRPWKKLLLLAGAVLACISLSDIVVTWIQSRKSTADIKLMGAESAPVEITQPPPWDDGVEEDLKSLDIELDSLLEQTNRL
jgi:serine/threonine protein kinase